MSTARFRLISTLLVWVKLETPCAVLNWVVLRHKHGVGRIFSGLKDGQTKSINTFKSRYFAYVYLHYLGGLVFAISQLRLLNNPNFVIRRI